MKNNSNISAIVTTGKAGSGKDYVLHSLIKDFEAEVPGINIKVDKFANTMKHMINSSLLSRVGSSVNGSLNLSEALISQTLPHYLKLADLNDPLALYNLGLLYENGIGVPLNLDTALDFYTDAAEISKNADRTIYSDSLLKISTTEDKLRSTTTDAKPIEPSKSMPEDVFEGLKNDGNLKFVVGKDANNNDVRISIREMLQKLGTDIIRDVSKNFHIAMLARKMLDSDADVFAMGDVRFDNELLFVSTLNSLSTPEEKYNFLNSVAHLDESSLPTPSELEDKLKELFGDGPLLSTINESLIEHFYDPKYTRTSDNSVDDMSHLLSGEYEFDNPPTNESLPLGQDPYQDCFTSNCQVGIVPISRGNGADRAMDTTHDSELKALQIDEIVAGSPFPDGFVFMNNVDSLPENKQYFLLKDFIKESIICPSKDECLDSSMQP